MERLGRGVVAVPRAEGGAFVSWRLLGTEPEATAFNVYRATGDGKPVQLNDRPLTGPTHLIDANPNLTPLQVKEILVKTATNGETASFLAGGEFPIPVSQKEGVITIEFKNRDRFKP